MREERFFVVYTTIGEKEEARKIAYHLLRKRLIACANIFPIDSLYWWQGKIEKGREFGLFLKTKGSRYKALEKEVKKVHPYKIPCILAFEIKKGEKNYLHWIKSEVI
uniref:Divalent-cation tolerance protein CutA n=1 Tax=candidate division WOR-3 bacterium TaxID=2052148 RepID=A0A7C3URH3_UNCW3